MTEMTTTAVDKLPRSAAILDLVAVFTAGAVVTVSGFLVVGEGLVARQLVLWTANLAMIATVFACLGRRNVPVATLGLERPETSARALFKLASAALVTLVASLTAFVAGGLVVGAFAGEPTAADTSSYDFLAGNLPMLLLVLAGVFVASSFGEEWIYRGFVTTRLAVIFGNTGRIGPAAVIASSVVFGLAHFDWGFVGVVQTSFMGGVLTVAWLRTGRNLWVVFAAHAILDATLMIQMYLG